MTEAQLHRLVIDWMRACLTRTTIFFTVPNMNAHGQPGLTPGVPDICIVRNGGAVGFIELKTAKGKLSEHQKAFLDRCTELGIPAAVCRSLDDVIAVLRDWNVPMKVKP